MGDTLWTKYIGTSDWDFFYDVAPTYDHKFILAGGTYGMGNGDEDMWFVKIDSAGNVVWEKTYGGVKQDEARGIIQTKDSMIATAGFTFSLGDTLGDSWILRMNEANGDTAWARTAGYTGEDKSWGISEDSTFGRIFFCGENSTVAGNQKDAYFGALFYNGTTQFIYTTGGNLDEAFYGITVRADGSLGAVGVDYTVGAGSGDMYLFNNRTVWTSTNYGSAQFDVGYSVDDAHDGGYIMVGYTEGFNSLLPNIYLVKADTNGNSTIVIGIREQPAAHTFGLASVFPNPTQNEAVINFDSYESINGELKMEIFDVTGRTIMAIPFSQWQISTAHNAICKIQTANLNNGIYQYIISDQSGGKCAGKFIVSH
jgi:hypothetical protein